MNLKDFKISEISGAISSLRNTVQEQMSKLSVSEQAEMKDLEKKLETSNVEDIQSILESFKSSK
jgi:hypothetical protein